MLNSTQHSKQSTIWLCPCFSVLPSIFRPHDHHSSCCWTFPNPLPSSLWSGCCHLCLESLMLLSILPCPVQISKKPSMESISSTPLHVHLLRCSHHSLYVLSHLMYTTVTPEYPRRVSIYNASSLVNDLLTLVSSNTVLQYIVWSSLVLFGFLYNCLIPSLWRQKFPLREVYISQNLFRNGFQGCIVLSLT